MAKFQNKSVALYACFLIEAREFYPLSNLAGVVTQPVV